ncbi:MAG: murein biosynthesis integral membrane protein MurJ [Acidimicrobiaceae bacterium]|nr:murein biosynthesis integral membrane protein MurJ [Acidimicrobiaceae bacterium]
MKGPQSVSAPKRSGSVLVALGIALSRASGLLRELVASRVFGLGLAADAFSAASQIPNLLQNLLGEGVMSASFVPVYSKLLDEEDPKESSRVAGAVGALLLAVTGVCVGVFVLAARPITSVLAFGLSGRKFEIVVDLVQIMALGMGFLVMSAWCLGVLNSHRRFFLPYAAPVIWNACQIVALYLMWVRDWDLVDAARGLALAVTIGALLQLLIQLPTVLRLAKGLRFRPDAKDPSVREVRRRFVPAVLGRGVVQVSAYLDLMLATLLATGAIAALIKAQLLYTLPVSLFAMSVAAAELPELSRLVQDRQQLGQRFQRGLQQIAFWMLLASFVSLVAGDLIIRILFEGGEFDRNDAVLVWFVLGAYAIGLPAIGASRLLQNTCYAFGDTRGPARIAGFRVVVSATVALLIMFSLDRVIVTTSGLTTFGDWFSLVPLAENLRAVEGPVRLGAVGLAGASALGAWVELILLSVLCRGHLPRMANPLISLYKPAIAAAGAFVLTAALRLVLVDLPLLITAPVVIAVALISYVIIGARIGVQETRLLVDPLRKVFSRSA